MESSVHTWNSYWLWLNFYCKLILSASPRTMFEVGELLEMVQIFQYSRKEDEMYRCTGVPSVQKVLKLKMKMRQYDADEAGAMVRESPLTVFSDFFAYFFLPCNTAPGVHPGFFLAVNKPLLFSYRLFYPLANTKWGHKPSSRSTIYFL